MKAAKRIDGCLVFPEDFQRLARQMKPANRKARLEDTVHLAAGAAGGPVLRGGLAECDGAVTAAVVVLVDGEQWTRMPEDWVETAELCSANSDYEHHGVRWQARCLERSRWVHRSQGLCGTHLHRLLDCG